MLCIDNPAADEGSLETLLRQIPDHCSRIHILIAEREHRYHEPCRTAGCLTYLHGEEEADPIIVSEILDSRGKRLYGKLFDLLEVPDSDRAALRGIVLNEWLVYVNATYSILLDLKKKRRIDFDFDWDDYRKSSRRSSGFRRRIQIYSPFLSFWSQNAIFRSE